MYQIIMWFKKTYPQYVQDMKDCQHDISLQEQSMYHTEGDVYTHTMMVCGNLQKYENKELFLAGLLHDIGKPKTRHKKEFKNSMSFTKHEAVSAFMAIDILDQYEKDFNEKLDKELIIKAIFMHQFFHPIGKVIEGEFFLEEEDKLNVNKTFGRDLNFYESVVRLGKADIQGRFSFDMKDSLVRYGFFEDYIPYEYQEKSDSFPKAYIMTGLPTSGKSEYIKKHLKGIKVLSTDEIMKTFVKGDLSYNMYYSPENVEKAEDILYAKMKELIVKRESFVIDQTNITERVRNRKASIIPDKYYKKISITCLIGEKELFRRNKKRQADGKHIPEETLLYKAKEFDLPKYDIFDEVHLIF